MRWQQVQLGRLVLVILLVIGGLVAVVAGQQGRSPHAEEALLLPSGSPSAPMSELELAPRREPDLRYERHELEASIAHVVFIPSRRYLVRSASVDGLATVEQFAEQLGAIAVLNAGFFDPVNQETTSYIVSQGDLIADPQQNERLVENPDLTPYLNRILNRSEFRRYQCDDTTQYAIAPHDEPPPDSCRLVDAVGGGPQLLPDLGSEAEGFVEIVEGTVVRDAIGSFQRNARTAIGIDAVGDVIWVMIAQQPAAAGASGMTLTELANLMQTLGAIAALNLDGGSSSSLFYDRRGVYGRQDDSGTAIQRAVKSVLWIPTQ